MANEFEPTANLIRTTMLNNDDDCSINNINNINDISSTKCKNHNHNNKNNSNNYSKDSQESLNRLKIFVSNVKNMAYCIVLLLIHFDRVTGQSIESISITSSKDNHCSLDNAFTFGLSLTYAGVSIITLIGVSLWSFKSMTGLYLNIYTFV